MAETFRINGKLYTDYLKDLKGGFGKIFETILINGKTYTNQKKDFQEGAFGEIFLVKDEKNKKYILKKTKQQLTIEETQKNIENTKKEVDILKKLEKEKCPHIIKVVDSLQIDDNVYILLEYGEGGDLVDFRNNLKTKISQETFLSYIMQILEAVSCFHNSHIFNLDLKPENIIFKDTNHKDLAIIDFGLAVESNSGKCNFKGGTLTYQIHEERQKEYDCAKADIYSLGIIIGILFSITQFNNNDIRLSYEKIIKTMKHDFAPSRPATVMKVIEEILKIHDIKDDNLDRLKDQIILQPIFLYYIKEGTTEEDLKGSFQETIENEGMKDDLGDKALSELKSLILTDTNSILLKWQNGFVILTKNKNTDLNKYTERIVEKNVQKLLDFKFKPKKSQKKSKTKIIKKSLSKKKSLKKKSLKKKSKTKVIKKSRSKKL
jgi:serine/threonine protein kinase